MHETTLDNLLNDEDYDLTDSEIESIGIGFRTDYYTAKERLNNTKFPLLSSFETPTKTLGEAQRSRAVQLYATKDVNLMVSALNDSIENNTDKDFTFTLLDLVDKGSLSPSDKSKLRTIGKRVHNVFGIDGLESLLSDASDKLFEFQSVAVNHQRGGNWRREAKNDISTYYRNKAFKREQSKMKAPTDPVKTSAMDSETGRMSTKEFDRIKQSNLGV